MLSKEYSLVDLLRSCCEVVGEVAGWLMKSMTCRAATSIVEVAGEVAGEQPKNILSCSIGALSAMQTLVFPEFWWFFQQQQLLLFS